MDCCNYMQMQMQYRGAHCAAPQFYEGYGRDFYSTAATVPHHSPYSGYYTTSHYYPQQWPYNPGVAPGAANHHVAAAAAPFPDYVYNPKEARIRKAMREASRDRIGMGTTPIPPQRGGNRRLQPWSSVTPEEQLMMTPSGDINSSMCNSSVFPGMSGSQFHHTANYTKFVHVLPPNGWMNDFPSYLQHNPIAELQQHQANMWHQYQEPIRHCNSSSYMLQSQVNMYQETHEPQVQKKVEQPPPTYENFQQSNEISSRNTNERMAKEAPIPKQMNESSVPAPIPQENPPESSYYPSYQQANNFQNSFEKTEANSETRKFETPPAKRSPKSIKALPDFNEAFGSTERGRFQSPPDPRLTINNKDPFDYFFLNDEIRFDDYQT